MSRPLGGAPGAEGEADAAGAERAATKIQAVFRGKQVRAEQGGDAAITVGMRMRPFVPHELKKGDPTPCIRIGDNILTVVPEAGLDEKDSKEGPWKFDLVMDSSDSASPVFVDNAKCYELMGRRMIDDVLKGFNTCLFCYGQTGTGKTTTIMGDEQNGPGVLRRLLDDIFVEAEKMKAAGAQVSIEIQMLEVYNEDLHDLLLPKGKEKEKVQTRILPGGVTISGATTKEVHSADECQEEIDYGNSNKTMAATAMNPQSSRGHTVFKLVFKKSGGADGTKLSSEVYFADLAGHENIKTTAVTGDRLKELTFINGSLMWLQNALHSMAEASGKKSGTHKADFSKFRNSKLTLLLSNALTGNSKTAVIVTLSPSLEHFDTSLSSIKFGIEVKGIKVKATSTAGLDPKAIIAKLEKENQELKAKLAAAQTESGSPETREFKEELAELKEQLAAARAHPAEQDSQALRHELAEATKQLARAEARPKETDDQALKDEVRDLKEQLAASNRQLEAQGSAALKSQIAELEKRLYAAQPLKDELSEFKSELNAAQAGLGETRALRDEVVVLKEQLAMANTSSGNTSSGGIDTSALREEIGRLGERLADTQSLKNEVAHLKEELATAEQEPKLQETRALKSEIAELREQLATAMNSQSIQELSSQSLKLGKLEPSEQLQGGVGQSTPMEHLMRVLELSKRNVDMFSQFLKEHGGSA